MLLQNIPHTGMKKILNAVYNSELWPYELIEGYSSWSFSQIFVMSTIGFPGGEGGGGTRIWMGQGCWSSLLGV